jgi:hypothetical protein
MGGKQGDGKNFFQCQGHVGKALKRQKHEENVKKNVGKILKDIRHH